MPQFPGPQRDGSPRGEELAVVDYSVRLPPGHRVPHRYSVPGTFAPRFRLWRHVSEGGPISELTAGVPDGSDEAPTGDSRFVRFAVAHGELLTGLCFRVALVAFVLASLFPIYITCVIAVMPHLMVWGEVAVVPPAVSPEGFAIAVRGIPWVLALTNSLVVAVSTVVLVLAVSVPAGYVFGRLDFPGRAPLFVAVLLFALFPPEAIVRPLLLLFAGEVSVFGVTPPELYDTHLAVILPISTLLVPLAVALLTVFFAGIPDDLEGAARVQGATRIGALRHVVLPLARPGIVSVATLVFVEAYTEQFFTLYMSQGYRGVSSTVQSEIYKMFNPFWALAYPNAVAAAGVIGLIPSALVLLFMAGRLDSWLSAWGSVTR